MMDAAKLAEELRGEQETAQVIIKNRAGSFQGCGKLRLSKV
jgi:hypothetical protein